MKKILFTLIVLSTVVVSHAQTFSVSTTPYANLVGATRIAKDSVWDEFDNYLPSDFLIPLGFKFKAFGNEYDTLILDQVLLFSSDALLNIGMVEDLCDKGFGGSVPNSPISILRSGTAGNRIVKLEWRNYGFYGDFDNNGFCSDSGNTQIWIYESPSKVEMRWGKSRTKNFAADFPSGGPTVLVALITGLGQADGVALKGPPDMPDTTSVDPFNPAQLADLPSENIMYTFNFDKTSAVHGISKNSTSGFMAGNTLVLRGNPCNLIIYNMAGAVVKQINNAAGKIKLDDITPGVYVVRIAGGQSMKIQIQ